MPEPAFPSRVGIGDGPEIPCYFAGYDFTSNGAGPVIAGRRYADGTVYIDWVTEPVSDQTGAAGQSTFTADRAGWHAIGSPRPASDFLVDLDAPPNSCTRCGGDQRHHGEQHAYAAPTDGVRLARMKFRREKRLNPMREATPSPDLLIQFVADTTALRQAIERLADGLDRVAEASRPVAQAIRGRAVEDRIYWGDPIEESDANWPVYGDDDEDEALVCEHVCGADPGHACDARASTRLTYGLPSGGTRTMHICRPCYESEAVEVARA